MITFINNNIDIPYKIFREKYNQAYLQKQDSIQSIAISSFSPKSNEVYSRYVNLKIVDDKNFIFFTNYDSPKSKQFEMHNQISATIFWSKTNTQIRMLAKIQKMSKSFNNEYFINRNLKKNALAISSNQSNQIDSYSQVIENYNRSLESDDLKKCPDYWGGFSFIPYYFEFWDGHESRINKREVYGLAGGIWKHSFLQP